VLQLQFRPENAHLVPYGGGRVLVAAKSMSLFVMDPVSEAVLRYAHTQPCCTLEQIIGALADRFASPDIVDTVQEFMRLHILTTSQAAPVVTQAFLNVEHFPVSSLVVNVANKCNLHCTYCYEPEMAKYGPAPVQMSWDTARASVDFLFHKAGNSRAVNLIFFGGEALLNFKLMRQVVAYAEEKSCETGKTVDFSLTTNGTLLTDEIIDFFQAHRFGVTISMDGPQDLHDKRRSFLTSRGERKGSYDLLLPRVKRLLERYSARPVVARVTVTKGTVEVVRIYEHLSGFGFFEVGFSPVTAKTGADYGLEPADLRQVLAGFKELGHQYVERALQNQYTGFSNLSTLLTDLHAGTNKLFPCGAGLGLLDVDGNGDVYLCHRFPGIEEHRYGNIRDGLDYDRLNEFVNSAHVGNKPVCQTCWIRGICGGGCYHEAYTQFGDGALPNLHYCDFLREWTEYGIGVYMELQEKNPGFVERYVLRGRGDAPKELT
jgi:uncharacterized protein